jgi:hypothetical protein
MRHTVVVDAQARDIAVKARDESFILHHKMYVLACRELPAPVG